MAAPADIAAFLKSVKLFREFTDSELLAFAGRLDERTLKQGQVLFREGDPGEEMFVVQKGTTIISKVVSGRVEQVLARATAGDFFGEMSLFDRSPRSATIQAETDVALLVLDREHLNLLIEVNPRAAAAFFHSLVYVFIERLRASGELVAEITRCGRIFTQAAAPPRRAKLELLVRRDGDETGFDLRTVGSAAAWVKMRPQRDRKSVV